jgi:hypothetical protein
MHSSVLAVRSTILGEFIHHMHVSLSGVKLFSFVIDSRVSNTGDIEKHLHRDRIMVGCLPHCMGDTYWDLLMWQNIWWVFTHLTSNRLQVSSLRVKLCGFIIGCVHFGHPVWKLHKNFKCRENISSKCFLTMKFISNVDRCHKLSCIAIFVKVEVFNTWHFRITEIIDRTY